MIIKAGTYRFNDVLDIPDYVDSGRNPNYLSIEQSINFFGFYDNIKYFCDRITALSNTTGIKECQFNFVSVGDSTEGFPMNSYVYSTSEGGWKKSIYGENIQTIIITEDAGVNEEFYDWFAANTVEQTQISGVWRITAKENISFPDEEISQEVSFSIVCADNMTLEPATYRCANFDIDAMNRNYSITINSIESSYPHEVPQVRWMSDYDNISWILDFGTDHQLVSVRFYEWFTSNAQQESYKTIKSGRYRINDEISAFPFEGNSIEQLEFYCSGFSTGNGKLYTAYCSGFYLTGEEDGLLLGYIEFKTTPEYPEKGPMVVFTHEDGVVWNGWVYNDPQLITIPKDAIVSSSFYDWFTANSYALESEQISGIWKLNEQITFPQNNILEFVHFSVDLVENNTQYTALYSAAGIDATNEELSGYQYTCMPEIAGFNPGLGIGYENGSWLWDTWGNAVNVLDFGTEPQYVSVEFYNWLTENIFAQSPINFSTLQGLQIPEGVVTQIEDEAGRVIWFCGKPVILEVEKITSDTYAAETTYTAEEFILLDIYPKTNGTVSVTYGGLTKTITDTSGAEEPNAQEVFFGTFNGVSDSVETPSSGELTIEGDCNGFACGIFNTAKYTTDSFKGITAIRSLSGVSEIYTLAFAGCKKISSVRIPYNIKEIGAAAFANCINLKDVILSEGIRNISSAAFHGCPLLGINIPASVTEIASATEIGLFLSNPFYDCSQNNFITVAEGNLHFKIDSNCLVEIATARLIAGFIDSIIPSYIEQISDSAFRNCTELTNIDIPNSVTNIDLYAFYGCSSLTSIVIPEGVTSIGSFAFCNCESLTSITIPDSVTSLTATTFANTAYYNDESNWENGVLYIDNHLIEAKEDISGEYSVKQGTLTIADNAFSDCQSFTNITIPDSVTSIGGHAFYHCTSLTSIVIPDSVTSIGRYAFSQCTGLTRITILDGVISIGEDAFYNCNNLTSITIPDSVTSIGEAAFYDCDGLTSVTIGDSVTTIGERAFASCTALKEVVVLATTPPIASDATNWFDSCPLSSIIVPKGCGEAYKTAEGWSIYADYIKEAS